MMREEREQSRAICEAATAGNWYWENGLLLTDGAAYLVMKPWYDDETGEVTSVIFQGDAEFIAHARTALPAALKALDAEIKRADLLQSTIFVKNDEIDKLWTDRDRWKARAEALERAIKKVSSPGTLCIMCLPIECDKCAQSSDWQFDVGRYTTKKEDAQA